MGNTHQKDWGKIKKELDELRGTIKKDGINTDNRDKIRNRFTEIWDKDRLKEMTLDEYVIGKGNKYSFSYWVERELNGLGSIKGSTSIKFGIYLSHKGEYIYKKSLLEFYLLKKDKDKEDVDTYVSDFEKNINQFDRQDVLRAFFIVKENLIQIIKLSRKGEDEDLRQIDEIKSISTMFKWNVAFLYNFTKETIFPIFSLDKLLEKAENNNIALKGSYTIPILYEKIIEKKAKSDSLFDYYLKFWNKKDKKEKEEKEEGKKEKEDKKEEDKKEEGKNTLFIKFKNVFNEKPVDTMLEHINIKNDGEECIWGHFGLKNNGNYFEGIEKVFFYGDSFHNKGRKVLYEAKFIKLMDDSEKDITPKYYNKYIKYNSNLNSHTIKDKKGNEKDVQLFKIKDLKKVSLGYLKHISDEKGLLYNKPGQNSCLKAYLENKIESINNLKIEGVYYDNHKVFGKKIYIDFNKLKKDDFDLFNKEGLKSLTCIVGKNGSGKSTVLESLFYFFHNYDDVDQIDYLNLYNNNSNNRVSIIFSKIITKKKKKGEYYSIKDDGYLELEKIDINQLKLNNEIVLIDKKKGFNGISLLEPSNIGIAYISISPNDPYKEGSSNSLYELNDSELFNKSYLYSGVITNNAYFESIDRKNIIILYIKLLDMMKGRPALLKAINTPIKENFNLNLFNLDSNTINFKFDEKYLKNSEDISSINSVNKVVKNLNKIFKGKKNSYIDNAITDSAIKGAYDILGIDVQLGTDTSLEDLLGFEIEHIENILRMLILDYEITTTINGKQAKLEHLSYGELNLFGILIKYIFILLNYKKGKDGEIYITFDEPDTYLHPEWTRKFINMLVEINKIINPESNIHIILTTHSPIMLSDIPKSNIVSLDKGKLLKLKSETFLNNLFVNYANTFCVDSFYGELGINAFNTFKQDPGFKKIIGDKLLNNMVNKGKK